MCVTRYIYLIIGLLAFNAPVLVAAPNSCFEAIEYGQKVDVTTRQSLFVLIDQTTPLGPQMKARVQSLLNFWGDAGDKVTVVAFSANMRGRYPEVLFSQQLEPKPTQDYLYNLRHDDRKVLLECLALQQKFFRNGFADALSMALNGINPEIPKTDLLDTLKQVSLELVKKEKGERRILFLVSDGMENSSAISFYRAKTIERTKSRKLMGKIRRKGLVANWDGIEVYMYGLGLPSKPKAYVKTKTMRNLRDFWEHYFTEGNATIKAIGSPELLISSLE